MPFVDSSPNENSERVKVRAALVLSMEVGVPVPRTSGRERGNDGLSRGIPVANEEMALILFLAGCYIGVSVDR